MSHTLPPSVGTRDRALLGGATVAGGRATRERVSKLLGVDAVARLGGRVTAAAWVGDHLEVQVEQPGERPEVVFQLERHRQGRPCFVDLGSLDLFYRGDGLDPNLEAAVRAVAPRALGGHTVEALADLVARDPDAGRATEPVPAADEAEQADYDGHALLSTWGSPGVRTSFFATAEMARSQLDSLDFFDRCTFVQHCDQECLCVNPQTGVPMVPVVFYPWEDRLRRIDWREGAPTPDRGDDRPGMLTTDIGEADVIMGHGASRLDELLGHLAGDVAGDMAFCSCTCVPVVAGEDVEGVVARHRDAFDVPLLFLTTTPQSMQGVFRDLLVRRRLEAESRREEPPPGTVNLIGFPPGPPLEELRELLRLVGVSVNVALLPALSPELIDQLPAAGLNVQHPNSLWQGHYDQLQFDSTLEAVAPPAPYGVDGTLEWVEQVAHAAGVDGDPATALRVPVAAAREAVAAHRDEGARHRLGLVVRAAEPYAITDPAKTWGMPLVRLVEDLGFAVDVLVHVEDEADEGAPELIEEALGSSPRRRVLPFREPAELARHFDEGGLSAVYSEHFYDRRLSEHGLPAWSSQVFEHGLAGASRAQKRLLEICRTPYFARYGRHLRRGGHDRGLPDPLVPSEETP